MREVLNWKEIKEGLGQILSSQDDEGRNIMHIIAELKATDVFRSLISETKNHYLKEIKQALNIPISPSKPHLTPLAYA
jgi:hypothetical protein